MCDPYTWFDKGPHLEWMAMSAMSQSTFVRGRALLGLAESDAVHGAGHDLTSASCWLTCTK